MMEATPTSTGYVSDATKVHNMHATAKLGNWNSGQGERDQEEMTRLKNMMITMALSTIGPMLQLLYEWTLQYTFVRLGALLFSVQSEKIESSGNGNLANSPSADAKAASSEHQDNQTDQEEKISAAGDDKTTPNTKVKEESTAASLETGHPISPTRADTVRQELMDPSIASLLHRLLSNRDFFSGLFRGFWFDLLNRAAFTIGIGVAVIVHPLPSSGRIINYELSIAFATFATCHFLGAWVRYCVSTKSRGHVRAWIPPFWHTLRVTWRAHLLTLVVGATSRYLLRVIRKVYDLEDPADDTWRKLDTKTHRFEEGFWRQWGKNWAMMAVAVVVSEIPQAMACAILYRVHASMLPVEDTTLVAVDRAFGSDDARKRGYITLLEACRSVGLITWNKLLRFYARVGVMCAGVFAIFHIALPFLGHLLVALNTAPSQD